jgi:PKD domain-containing protein
VGAILRRRIIAMRANTERMLVTLAFALYLGIFADTPVWAQRSAVPPGPRPTQRQLTEEEQAILRKIILIAYADPDEGPAPLTVHFSVDIHSVDDPEHPKYVWNFGDGSRVVHEQNPTHTYKRAGKYKATFKITADGERAGSDDVDIVVQAPEH